MKSFFFVKNWIIEHLLSLPEIEALAESLYFPPFLRLLGMKIGKRVEIAELPYLTTPELATIHDEGFTASAVIVSTVRVHLGMATYAPTVIGKRTFVGSTVVLRPNAVIGNECLLGCLTVSPDPKESQKDNTAWLGSPPFYLPRRQIAQNFSEDVTFNPPKYLYILRSAIEFIRIILPVTFYFLILLASFTAIDFLTTHYSLEQIFLLFPFFEIAILLIAAALVIGLKWVLIGKYKPQMKPLWSLFIWKKDLMEHLQGLVLGRLIFEPMLGTPFVTIFLRLLGVKIGKRAFIDTPRGFTEYDLIDVGDDTAFNSDCTILTHLYEDRIFKMDKIKIKNGCYIGTFSKVTYDTIMEENSSLGSLSLLMKGERLPANTHWKGIPSEAYDVIS